MSDDRPLAEQIEQAITEQFITWKNRLPLTEEAVWDHHEGLVLTHAQTDAVLPLLAAREQAQVEAVAELAMIDAVLARRNALDDCQTRVEKIQKAIRTASVNDPKGELAASAAALARAERLAGECERLREALAAKDAEIARLPPCPWTREQVENMATRLDPLEKNGSPLGPNEWGAIDMLRYLAASLTRRTE
jgi:hypothetical protein